MKQLIEIKDQELLHKLTRGGHTNLSKWFERIADDFYEERAVDERVFVDSIKEIFYKDLTKQLLFSLPKI